MANRGLVQCFLHLCSGPKKESQALRLGATESLIQIGRSRNGRGDCVGKWPAQLSSKRHRSTDASDDGSFVNRRMLQVLESIDQGLGVWKSGPKVGGSWVLRGQVRTSSDAHPPLLIIMLYLEIGRLFNLSLPRRNELLSLNT